MKTEPKKLRVVLDTNVLFSILAFPGGRLDVLLDIVLMDKIDVIKTHAPDNRILECATSAKAQILVTGNMEDIRPLGAYRGIDIISPREFLDTYFSPS